MNRRSFLQSMSAAFGALALGVRPSFASPSRINYSLFTDKYVRRYDLTSPWSDRGVIAVTDAKILITHPGEWSGEASAKVPDIWKLWWGEFDATGWCPLRTVRAKQNQQNSTSGCPQCYGTGRIGPHVRQCDCDPLAEYTDHSKGYPRILDGCPQCQPSGWIGGVKCTACGGSGWLEGDERFVEQFQGVKFNPHYIARVRTLGEVDCRVIHGVRDTENASDLDVLLFRGADGLRAERVNMDVLFGVKQFDDDRVATLA